MAVVVQSVLGWVLDARSFIDQSYSLCTQCSGKKPLVRCSFKRQYFQTVTSHICEKKSEAESAGNAEHVNKKRKRKNPELNQGEIDIKDFHEKVRTVILEGTLSLVDSARACGYLNGTEEFTPEDPVTAPECGLSALCEMAKQLPLVDTEESDTGAQVLDGTSTLDLDLFSRMTENRSDAALVVTLMKEEYVIPAHSSFLLSDFTRLQPLVHHGVTTSGEFVFPLDSEHKKPYEVMVLGRYSSNVDKSESSTPSVLIKDHRLIVSVPSTLHSQKPCLSEVLKPYIKPTANCLELFARNLHPGWTSWGNEVLKFQHTSFFTMTSAEDKAD